MGFVFRRIFHWGPLLTISLVCYIFYWTLYTMSICWPWRTLQGAVHHVLFIGNVFLICINYFHAMFHGPGFVPLGWSPAKSKDQKYLQYCNVCQGFKAPRAHHCRSCGHCVMKMDHHCPWINSCVGHENHATFTRFVFHAPLGCAVACIYQSYFLYKMLFSTTYSAQTHYFLRSFQSAFMLFMSVGLSLGVALSVSVLLFYQVRSIIRNRTMVEDWILDKADYRHECEQLPPYVYPYDLGWKQNCMQVFLLSWYAKGDGITWTVRDGCDQYTLTKEQIILKQRKKERSRLYSCRKNFSGSRFTCRFGVCVCLSFPSIFEDRLPVSRGDTVLVSRVHSRWLYGEKQLASSSKSHKSGAANGVARRPAGPKGWFPKPCAYPLEKEE